MSADERLLRLENAFSTLAEIAGDRHSRPGSIEQSVQMLVDLVRRSDERVDQHQNWINQLGAAQANSEVKIAALADAQIRTEEILNRLSAAQAATDVKLSALADAQMRTEESLNRLAKSQAQDRRDSPSS